MTRLMLVVATVVALIGLSGQSTLAGSTPGKVSDKSLALPHVPSGGITGGTGAVSPGMGIDPGGKFSKVCPKYPQKYADCTPIAPAPRVVPPSAPAVLYPTSGGTIGTPYSSSIGIGEITVLSERFGLIGALPPGLTLNASTGAISGTPTTPGLYPFTVTITNSAGLSASSPCSITISLPPCTLTSATGCLFLRNVVVPADVGSNTSGTLTLNGVISFRSDCLGGCSGGSGTASGVGSYTISGGGAPTSGTFTITGSQGSAFISTQPPWGATCSAAVSSGYILLDVTGWFTDGSTGAPTWGDIAVNTSPSFSPGIGVGIGAQSFQRNSLAGVTISC